MKRWISLLLCLCLVLGMVPSSVLAAQNDADAMQSVLLTVKARVTIPKEYYEFHYQSELIDGALYWNFDWTAEDGSSIRVRADDAGRIETYRHYPAVNSEALPPKITKAEAITEAKKLLATMFPEVAASMKLRDISAWNYSKEYRINFVRYENEIPVPAQTIAVEVDYRTGRYGFVSSSIEYDTAFTKPESLLGTDSVRKSWIEMAQLELVYDIEASNVAKLRYVPNGEVRPINAQTGEIIAEDMVWEENGTMDSVAGGGGSSSDKREELTPEEQAKSEELAGLISKEAADRIVRKFPSLAIGNSDSLYAARLQSNHFSAKEPVKYTWVLEYRGPITKGQNPEYASAYVDAKSGELLSFRAYRDAPENKRKVKESSANATADALVKTAAAEKLAHLDKGVLTTEYESKIPASYAFCYDRLENGIPVSGNAVRVEVNSASGKVTYYNCIWTDDVEFEDPSGIIGLEKAEELFAQYKAPELQYYTQTVLLYDNDSDTPSEDSWYYSGIPTKKRVTLCYVMPADVFRIDAKSGEVHAHSNEADTTGQETYQDIRGHFAEREIQLLLDIGVLEKGEKFEPNQLITQDDFLYYLLAAHPRYNASRESVYDVAERNGILLKGERKTKMPINRSEAARIAVRSTDNGTIAKDFRIFRVDYHDASSIPQADLGYVAIAKSLGIMSGSNGMFYGTRMLTRGEAACLICKLLATLD